MSGSEIRSHEDPESSHQLSQFESAIKQLLACSAVPATLPDDLRQTLKELQKLAPLSNSMKIEIRHICYRFWFAVSAAFTQPYSSTFSDELSVDLYQISADLFFLSVDIDKASSVYKGAWYYCKTGQMWLHVQNLALAATCCQTAIDLVLERDFGKISERWATELLIDLARISWEVLDRNIASTLLTRAKCCLLPGANYPYKALANQYLMFANSANSSDETSELMKQALDVCQKGSGVMTTPEEIAELEAVRLEILLKMGEYEKVVEGVRELRKLNGDDNSVFASLAVKAHLELGELNEAERELKQMVFNKVIEEDVCVSPVETYFQAAQAQTAKGVYLGLLELCNRAMPLKEVVLLRTLVAILYRENGDGGELEALKLLKHAHARATELGPDLFYGIGVSEQIKFSVIAWNFGRKCWIQEKYELCIDFYRLVTEFNGGNKALVCKSFIWMVISMMAPKKQKNISLTENEVKQAVELLDKAAKMLPSIRSRTTLLDDYKRMARCFRLLIINDYSNGEFVYDMCQRVYQMMEGLIAGECFPIEEATSIFWIAMDQVKVANNLGKKKCFKRWTSIAFQLASRVPGMQDIFAKHTYKEPALQTANHLNSSLEKRLKISQAYAPEANQEKKLSIPYAPEANQEKKLSFPQ